MPNASESEVFLALAAAWTGPRRGASHRSRRARHPSEEHEAARRGTTLRIASMDAPAKAGARPRLNDEELGPKLTGLRHARDRNHAKSSGVACILEACPTSERRASAQRLRLRLNEVNRKGRITPRNATFFDETLRDGLQNPSVKDPESGRSLEILHLMEDLGIHEADIGPAGLEPSARSTTASASARRSSAAR